MKLGAVLVAAITAIGCQMNASLGPEWGGKGWREITTPHFVIDTDARDYRAMEIARTLEVTRAAMMGVAFTLAPEPPGRTRVIAIERDHRGVFPTGAKGFNLVVRPLERVIAFRSTDLDPIPGTFHHELAHHLSLFYWPIQPPWFAEGFANYLQSVHFDPEKKVVNMGIPPKWIGRVTPSSRMTTADILAVTKAHEAESEEVRRSFYANAWLLVTHLMNHHTSGFGDFQQGIGLLQDWRGVWKRTLPEPEVIDREIQAHFEEQTFVVQTVPFEPPEFQQTVRRLPPSAVSGLLAWLSLASRDPKTTVSLVEEALGKDAADIHALAVKFFRMAPLYAPSVAKTATDAHPENGLAWLMASYAAPDPESRLLAIERARRLAPDHWGVRMRLAQEKIEGGQAAQALVDTRFALRAGGALNHVVTAHLTALLANRRCRDANRLLANDIPGWTPDALEKLREVATPERAWCNAHPDYNTPNTRLPRE
jgi:hypothetical protein